MAMMGLPVLDGGIGISRLSVPPWNQPKATGNIENKEVSSSL